MKSKLLLFLLVLFLMSSFASASFYEWAKSKNPSFSPFPDFAPFEVSVTFGNNFPPFVEDLANEVYVCEGNLTSVFFNVSDADADLSGISISPTFPLSPFFVHYTDLPLNDQIEEAEIFSVRLNKNPWVANQNDGFVTYPELIEAVDSQGNPGSQMIDITAIEINNDPNVVPIGVQTFVWLIGENSTFFHQVQVQDIEDGNQNTGNINFGLTFLNGDPMLFDISPIGVIQFTPNETVDPLSLLGVYDIQVCAIDQGIPATHPLIFQECGQDGGPIQECFDFSLTITNNNRPPKIDSFFPENVSFDAVGEEQLYFNISTHDPDGTVPDVYWYIENVSVQYNNASNYSEFSYAYECGISGEQNITAEVTDGLLNASVTWNISLENTPCPTESSGGGGGGGGGGRSCIEKWGCPEWDVCQNTQTSLDVGIISLEDFTPVREICDLGGLGDKNCGFQIRDCIDINGCNTTFTQPEQLQQCFYTLNPSCADGVKNCHNGACETLVDCGGSCGACATCSDKIQNQGEQGVDCEGPCPFDCEPAVPLLQRASFRFVLIAIAVLLLGVIIIKLFHVFSAQRKLMSDLVKEVNQDPNV